MAGGQKGLSFIGEPMMFASAASALITILLLAQFNLLSCSPQQPDPQGDFQTACAQADVDRRSGAEDVNTVILADSECVEYLMYQEAREQQDRAEELQEAQP